MSLINRVQLLALRNVVSNEQNILHIRCSMCNNYLYLHLQLPQMRTYVSAAKDDSDIPRNLLEEFQTSHQQKETGAIFDKKPFKITLEAGTVNNCTFYFYICSTIN